MGLGCSIAVLCDIVLMSEKAYLADPHVSVGLVAGDGGAAFWPLLAPILRIREYLFTGDRIPAELQSSSASPPAWSPPTSCWPKRAGWPSGSPRSPPRRCRGTKRVAQHAPRPALGGRGAGGLRRRGA